MEDKGHQREDEVEFPGIIEKPAMGSFTFFRCPHCDEGKADFASHEAREQHLKDYHKLKTTFQCGVAEFKSQPGPNLLKRKREKNETESDR